jgi:hypothetical protein
LAHGVLIRLAMKKTSASKKLLLSVERVRDLQPTQLDRVGGGRCATDTTTGGDGGGGDPVVYEYPPTSPCCGTDPATNAVTYPSCQYSCSASKRA